MTIPTCPYCNLVMVPEHLHGKFYYFCTCGAESPKKDSRELAYKACEFPDSPARLRMRQAVNCATKAALGAGRIPGKVRVFITDLREILQIQGESK